MLSNSSSSTLPVGYISATAFRELDLKESMVVERGG
jgi:hypothetical protein